MARKPRVHYEGALYHVIVRGNNREYIFKEEKWKRQYLEIIKKYKQKFDFKLYSYVVMDNHVHLLIEVNHVSLSKIMQCVQQVFTQTYNRKIGRTGHVFEQRFKAILCNKDEYLLMLIRYIHQNTIRAGLVKGLEYKWSSYGEYLDKQKNELADIAFPLSLFDNRLDQFKRFMEEEETNIKEMTIRDFSEDIDEYKEMKEQEREVLTIDLESIVHAVCELMKVEVNQINMRTRLRKIANARQLIAYIAIQNPHISQRQIAECFNLKQNSVSMMLSKENVRVKFEEELRKLVIK